MKVLMSIKPQYANKIFSGEKLYELRRVVFKQPVTRIVVYSSSPVMKIIGEIEIDKIISDTPENIFNQFKDLICITNKDYFKYFEGSDIAYAIKIKNTYKYPIFKELSDFGIKRAPQSYIYLK